MELRPAADSPHNPRCALLIVLQRLIFLWKITKVFGSFPNRRVLRRVLLADGFRRGVFLRRDAESRWSRTEAAGCEEMLVIPD